MGHFWRDCPELAAYQEQRMAQGQATSANANYHSAAEELGIWDNAVQGTSQTTPADTSTVTGYGTWADDWFDQQWDD
eukprot:2607263-Rhodomonas_salina.1